MSERRPGPPTRIIRRYRPPRTEITISQPDAYERPVLNGPLGVALGSAGLVILGTVLLLLPGMSHEETSPGTAAFTAVSALTTTGFTVVDTSDHWTVLGQAVILLLIQAGAFGFTLLATAFLWTRSRQLGITDALFARPYYGPPHASEILRLATRIAALFFAVEGVAAALLFLAFVSEGIPVERAAGWGIFHAGSAYSNTGFSVTDEGLVEFREKVPILLALAFAGILGSLGPIPVLGIIRWRAYRRLSLDITLILITTAGVIGVGMLFFLATEWNDPLTYGSVHEAKRPVVAFFETAMRASGMSVFPRDVRDDGSLYFGSALTFVGGAAGSVTGGIKVGTLAVIVASIVASLRADERVTAFKREIDPRTVQRAISIMVIMLLAVLAAIVVFSVIETQSFFDTVKQSVGALTVAGSSTEPVAQLNAGARWYLGILMIVGRFLPLALVYVMTEPWARSTYRLAEDSIRIG